MDPAPPPPPPLPPGPPPPLPSDDATDDAPPSQLAQLFREHKAAPACQFLLGLSAREAAAELQAAFGAVEWAPNAFLLALTQWPVTAPRNVFFSLVSTGSTCMAQRQHAPSPMVSDLAGALLLEAFHDCRAHTCAAFVAAFHVPRAHLQAHCQRLLPVQAKHVVTLLDALGERALLSLDAIVAAAWQQHDLDAADSFARNDPALQRMYVQMLIDRRVPDKLIKKRLQKFKLQGHEFPEYHARKIRASIRFLVYSQQFEDVLALVQGDAELTLYACHIVVENRGSADLVTRLFIHRAGLAGSVEFSYIDTAGMASHVFPNKDDLEPLALCLSINDLIGEDACVFVDTPEALAVCVAHLKEASVVGFDCEWKGTTTRGQQNEACAILQVASASKAFVIDVIALKGQCTPLGEVFHSESIVKLGFDTKGDLSVLAGVLPSTDSGLVRNLVDLQVLAKRLKSVKRPRIASELASASREEELEDGEIEEGEIADEDAKADDTVYDLNTIEQDAVKAEEQNDTVKPATIDMDSSGPATKKHKKKLKRRDLRGGDSAEGDKDGSRLSLAAVAEDYLGKPLDKRSRMSDWERRPLTKAQLHYAAMDALVLVLVFDTMRQRYSNDQVDKVLAQMARPRTAGSNLKERLDRR